MIIKAIEFFKGDIKFIFSDYGDISMTRKKNINDTQYNKFLKKIISLVMSIIKKNKIHISQNKISNFDYFIFIDKYHVHFSYDGGKVIREKNNYSLKEIIE